MTFLEAAIQVLRAQPGGGPLHFEEIASQAIEKKLLESGGLTPEATMGAQLYVAVRRDRESGREPRFVQVGRGMFALAAHGQGAGVEAEAAAVNKRTREGLLQRLKAMTPAGFEQLIAKLLSEIGYEDVVVTGRSGDRGIDAIGRLSVDGVTDVATAIQAKRWEGTIGGKIVREMRGSLSVDQRGLIITTAHYSREALLEATAAAKQRISLVDGEKLVDLLIKYHIGIRKKSLEIIQLDLEALDFAEDAVDQSKDRGKSVSLWPLPGGKQSYYDTLLTFLREISTARPGDESMVKWIQKAYPQVKSAAVAGGYVRVVRALGLAEYDGENLVLTEAGAKFLGNPTRARLAAQFEAQVLGVSEIKRYLESGPQRKEDIHKRLIAELNLSWETPTQTDYRLDWLRSLEVVDLNDGRVSLRPA